MQKKINISGKPTSLAPSKVSAETWIKDRVADEPMKRLTVDIPLSLHKTIKVSCASRGTNISDEVRELLEKKYSEEKFQGHQP